MLTSLRYRDFRLVWIGSATEHFTENMETITILWLVNEMTHSPLMLTLVGACYAIPMLFFPILGGVAADRMNRRNLLTASLAMAALVSVSLAILVVTDIIAVWHLIVIPLLTGVATSFNHPARQTIVPNLVRKDHLLNAISLDTFSVFAVRVIAMPITGYLIVLLGIWPIFIFRAIGAVIPMLLLRFVKTPLNPPAVKEQRIMLNLRAGFHYLRSNTILLRMLALYIILGLVMGTVMNLLPAVTENILEAGAVMYGYLQGALGLGALVCLIILAMLTYYKGKLKLLLGAGIILGMGLLGFSGSRWVFLSLPLLVIIGGMSISFMAIITALVQQYVSDEMRGRVMSWREIASGLSPVGMITFGAIAEHAGLPFSFALQGGICLLMSFLLVLLLPKLRSLE